MHNFLHKYWKENFAVSFLSVTRISRPRTNMLLTLCVLFIASLSNAQQISEENEINDPRVFFSNYTSGSYDEACSALFVQMYRCFGTNQVLLEH